MTAMAHPQVRGPASSAARHAHMARYSRLARAPVDDEVVALGFARDGLVNGAIEQGLIGAGAQGRPQVCRIVLAEAHVQCAGASKPHTIATLAKIVRHRRVDSEAAT